MRPSSILCAVVATILLSGTSATSAEAALGEKTSSHLARTLETRQPASVGHRFLRTSKVVEDDDDDEDEERGIKDLIRKGLSKKAAAEPSQDIQNIERKVVEPISESKKTELFTGVQDEVKLPPSAMGHEN
ncbi:unnamed protein product [Phytophthora lilii]|uniref:RxLR effector protein n=1 Tax=Phytophthora lilii TaxID=2077276 RepID=A0A9W6WLU5_9STRA|nr:unnamed protein product [Phytophthora lilii]